MRALVAALSSALLVCLVLLASQFRRQHTPTPAQPNSVAASPASSPSAPSSSNRAPTNIYAHNLVLRRGPDFRIYVRWLRGWLTPVSRNVIPSFDDPESFLLDIGTGVLRVNIGDICNFLNRNSPSNAPLKHISLSGDGKQIKLKATLQKVLPLPVELDGELSAAAGNLVRIHVTKLKILKIPVKGLLKDFHVDVADLFRSPQMPGIQVSGNDILLDSQRLLPPPHIRGELTLVHIANPDLEEVYGNAKDDVSRVEQWRNFLRLRDGTIDFGKLTMHHVDLIMIDVSQNAWFDLDLAHYQEQLVNGYTRMTPQAGLQIFMPNLDQIPRTKFNQDISVQWMKNRNIPPPPDIVPQ